MSKDPAFLFYPGDYLRDTQCLSEGAQVAYDRIMCEHMRNIPVSQERLNFFTKRLNDDQKEEIKSVLAIMDGGFVIDWVYTSILKRRAYSQSRAKNRLGTVPKDMKSYDSHMENENEIVNGNEVFNTIQYKKDVKEIFDFFCFTLKKKIILSTERHRIIEKRLQEGRTVAEMRQAITNFSKDDWDGRHKFCDLVYAIGVRNKVDNLDKWLHLPAAGGPAAQPYALKAAIKYFKELYVRPGIPTDKNRIKQACMDEAQAQNKGFSEAEFEQVWENVELKKVMIYE